MSAAGLQSLLFSRRTPAVLLAGVVGALLVTLMALPLLEHRPLYDELLHVLSARGFLETGGPAIADGSYERAVLFTWLVSKSLALFGDSLTAARLPPLVAGALLLLLLGAWIARRAGLAAGLGAGVVLAALPATLDLTVMIRFYTLHALLILLIAVCAHEASAAGKRPLARWLAGAAACLLIPFAWHLQPSTAVAVLSIAAGTAAVLAIDHWVPLRAFVVRHPLACALAVMVMGALGLWLAAEAGLVSALRETPVWASWAKDKFWFYVVGIAEDWPLLWPLFPVATWLAFRLDRRLALFCLVVFAVGLSIHSIAAAKQTRYVYYLFPFAAAVYGLALGQVLKTAAGTTRWLPVLGLFAAGAVLSAEGQGLAKHLLGRGGSLAYTSEAEWSRSTAVLQPLVDSADVVVTSNAMKSLYYLGRYEYELHVSNVAETDNAQEFGRDVRTGRIGIGAAASVSRVLDEGRRTLFVLEEESLGSATAVPAESVAVIESRCDPFILPAGSGLAVWRCGDWGGVPDAPR